MLKLRKQLITLKLGRKYYASQIQKDIVIAAAVRTPFTDFSKHETIDITSRLFELTTEAVIKQAALPKEDIEVSVFTKKAGGSINTIQTDLLRKDVSIKHHKDSIGALKVAVDDLDESDKKSIIITGMDSITAASFRNHFSNVFNDEEIIPISLRQKQRRIVTVTQDELTEEESMSDIGTALALTTSKNAERLNIKPLARISMMSSSENYVKSINELLGCHALNVQDINRWIMLSETPGKSLANDLNINPAHIQTMSTADYCSISEALQVTHLAHSLKPRQMACVVVPLNHTSTSVMLLQKCSNEMTDHLPLLTLYTKDPCPLCDKMVEELESYFLNEYRLEKVFIDRKENVRFLRLFRYDIPVLFLNGQFLCMHNLNSKILKRKLQDLK